MMSCLSQLINNLLKKTALLFSVLFRKKRVIIINY